VYRQFCIFFIIIILSFVVLLNCLYFNLRVLLFVHPPPHPTGCGEERVSSCLVLVASCKDKPQQICKIFLSEMQTVKFKEHKNEPVTNTHKKHSTLKMLSTSAPFLK